MIYAKGVSIDGFALNMAANDTTNDKALPLAFSAAKEEGFKLLFSFDYAGNGPWRKSKVIQMIQEYGVKAEYFKRGSLPLVSTFEGPKQANEWNEIKKAAPCFFMPDWSSVGAQPAYDLGNKVADGLFSWDAWPHGEQNMTTFPDASYHEFLKGKPYMMPVSPWFYTNLPGYKKNWLWKGDELWYHRWQQAISMDNPPDYIQIISWNDYGESHYIGPLDATQYEAFEIGKAPFNFVEGMPHDGWRHMLPYYISMYKTGSASFDYETIVAWYRLQPNGACGDGGTTGNTALQLQLEFSADAMMRDRIYYTALLSSSKNVYVLITIGTTSLTGYFDKSPHGGIGMHQGSVPINGLRGAVTIRLVRGSILATINGPAISAANCPTDIKTGKTLNNYNAWVGSNTAPAKGPWKTSASISPMNCTDGFGVYDFDGLCGFACKNGYCPSAACVCLAKGIPSPPAYSGDDGYPGIGKSMIYKGLCSFNCNHGYCPSPACQKTPNEGVVPTFSPFLPPACRAGKKLPASPQAFTGLCSFSCTFGFCPRALCECTATGVLVDAPGFVDTEGYYLGPESDHGLCHFAATHNYLPDSCGNKTTKGDLQTVTVDPAVWAKPTVQCVPPCVLVFPPETLASPTTIYFPSRLTRLDVGYTTTDNAGKWDYRSSILHTWLPPFEVVTTIIRFSDYYVSTTLDGGILPTIIPEPSVQPTPRTITIPMPTNAPSNQKPTPRIINHPPWPFRYTGTTKPGPSETTTKFTPVPTETAAESTFPVGTVSWVTGWMSEPTSVIIKDDDDDEEHLVAVIPCWVWFIWSCPPNVGGIVLPKFKKPGVYPMSVILSGSHSALGPVHTRY